MLYSKGYIICTNLRRPSQNPPFIPTNLSLLIIPHHPLLNPPRNTPTQRRSFPQTRQRSRKTPPTRVQHKLQTRLIRLTNSPTTLQRTDQTPIITRMIIPVPPRLRRRARQNILLENLPMPYDRRQQRRRSLPPPRPPLLKLPHVLYSIRPQMMPTNRRKTPQPLPELKFSPNSFPNPTTLPNRPRPSQRRPAVPHHTPQNTVPSPLNRCRPLQLLFPLNIIPHGALQSRSR